MMGLVAEFNFNQLQILFFPIDSISEPLYGQFYPLHLRVHQFDEYWLANNRLALLLKHRICLLLQVAFRQ